MDQHILAVTLVFRRYQPQAALVQQAANDGLLGAFDDLDHTPFRAAFAVLAHDAHLDAVFVQNRPHFIGGQIDIGLTVFTDQEAMTIAVTLHLAFDFFQHPAGWSYFFNIQSLDS